MFQGSFRFYDTLVRLCCGGSRSSLIAIVTAYKPCDAVAWTKSDGGATGKEPRGSRASQGLRGRRACADGFCSSCQQMFHLACIFNSPNCSFAHAQWQCANCLKKIDQRQKSEKPVGKSAENPSMDSVLRAIEFLGGQIDIFDKIVVKFRKRMDDFERTNRQLVEENCRLRESIAALRSRVDEIDEEKAKFRNFPEFLSVAADASKAISVPDIPIACTADASPTIVSDAATIKPASSAPSIVVVPPDPVVTPSLKKVKRSRFVVARLMAEEYMAGTSPKNSKP
ncbi:unnamed protein product [Nesidiocoris tenuis]|uniref:Uncharacterized protein n=1 Tax=Nesidiocoris tenuis TaxID=355587 RepID=A0A6H5GGP5_9HEMI|nr:unnamed protein product [Nesidiocoris tenuis]